MKVSGRSEMGSRRRVLRNDQVYDFKVSLGLLSIMIDYSGVCTEAGRPASIHSVWQWSEGRTSRIGS